MSGAAEYGHALFLLTEEEKTTERVLGELEVLSEVLAQNPSYTKLLDTPAVPKDERIKLVDEAFGSFDENFVNLIKIMAEARSTHLLDDVRRAFNADYCRTRGVLHAEAITALPLSDEQKAKMTAKLEAKTGKKIILKNTVEKSILGGVVLRYEGVQLDGSVKTRLEKFEKALTETVI